MGSIGELAPDEPHPTTAFDGLTDAERQIYEALPGRGGATVDQIAVGSGMAPERVLGPLAVLELAGLVQRQDGQWRIVRAFAGQAASTARLV
jgi:DNA processing protein